MAPVLTIMEAELLHRMRLLVGWEDGDGIFTPGVLFPSVPSPVVTLVVEQEAPWPICTVCSWLGFVCSQKAKRRVSNICHG